MAETVEIIIPLKDAKFCVNCDVVFYAPGDCPACRGGAWVYLKSWVEEVPRDPKEVAGDPA